MSTKKHKGKHMTRDDIIRMAREAGIHVAENNSFADDMYISVLYRFANIVAAAEQDRCCKIVYGMAGSDNVAQRTVDAIRRK